MTTAKKSRRQQMRELKNDLHYYQQMAKVDASALRASIRKVKEIGAKMRKLQAEEQANEQSPKV